MISARNRAGCCACALAISALGVSSTFAEEFEQHGAHEHGKVTLNVAVDGNKLQVVLEAPAVNVVGFEHAPQSEAERATATRVQARLQSGQGLIGVPHAAQCRLERARVEAPAWSSHVRASEREQHGEYEATLTYICQAPERLTWFEPWLLDKLHDVAKARVNLISPRGQRSEIVGRARTRVAL